VTPAEVDQELAAWDAGVDAYHAKLRPDACPYAADTQLANAWLHGFHAARRESVPEVERTIRGGRISLYMVEPGTQGGSFPPVTETPKRGAKVIDSGKWRAASGTEGNPLFAAAIVIGVLLAVLLIALGVALIPA
jgi:hypothetical protein